MYVCTRISDPEILAGSQSVAPQPGAMESQAAQDYGGVAADYVVRRVSADEHASLVAARDMASLTLDTARERKTAEIREAAEKFLAPFGAEYGPTERATWEQQLAEAKALQADPLAATPLLSAIAAARGQSVADLAGRVLANRAAWVVLAGHVTGQRLALQDQVDAAQDVAAVLAIVPAFSLPEG